MSALTLYKQYLSALDACNLNGVLAAFEPDATVASPTLGVLDAQSYYRRLFAHTNRSISRLLRVSESSVPCRSLTLHFHFTWVPKKGQAVDFDCVKVFELTSESSRFSKLTILCDATPVLNRLLETQAILCRGLLNKPTTYDEALSSVGL